MNNLDIGEVSMIEDKILIYKSKDYLKDLLKVLNNL